MKCKRCGQSLLLRSEQELSLCSICQQVLSRPPLIEAAFERTNSEASFFVDDLYALEEDEITARRMSSPPSPCPVPSGQPEGAPSCPPSPTDSSLHRVAGHASPDGTLFLTTIFTIFLTIAALWHLRPHLVGFNSLDALVVFGVGWLWAWWWKTLRKARWERNGHQ